MELPSPLQRSVKEKIPEFLLRLRGMAAAAATNAAVSPSQYLLGRISQDDHIDLPSPLQCSVKVKILGSDPTLMNMLDCQIFPLGHQYRIIGWNPEDRTAAYRGVAVLPLNKEGEGGGEFIMLLNFTRFFLVLRSAEMRWKRLENIPNTLCEDLVTYRGRFYAVFCNGDVFVIDPFSLEATPLIPLQPLISQNHLVPSGNDELFLVERIRDVCWSPFRVSRLDEEAGKWVEVSDLGDRVLFIGKLGNVSCSAKELPHGCGLSGNSILFTNVPGNVTNPCKYGVHLRRAKNNLKCWRLSRKNRVIILNTSPVMVFQVKS